MQLPQESYIKEGSQCMATAQVALRTGIVAGIRLEKQRHTRISLYKERESAATLVPFLDERGVNGKARMRHGVKREQRSYERVDRGRVSGCEKCFS